MVLALGVCVCVCVSLRRLTSPCPMPPVYGHGKFSASHPPHLDCPVTSFEQCPEPPPPNSRKAKRYEFESLDNEAHNSSRKQLRAQIQSLPAVSPTSLLYLQTPTPSSCLPWTPDALAEDSDDEEHGSTQHTFGGVEPTVSVLSQRQGTRDNSQASDITDLFDDQELEQLMVQTRDDIIASVPQALANQDGAEDTFSLAGLYEEAMAELLNESSHQATQRPPSSVVRAYNRDSRSANESGLGLQHSSPYAESSVVAVPFKDNTPLEQEVG
ncbi:hypothetical protein B0J13DRAFT_520878 [Dactylonectria estremocensis]|uniref:Uncharacterized protein n=1 Tax=Dactylonectria estremocensis TaxID=1079267 RepID=A0A9P9FDU7_9HYPO|nr:hypothetical protein B0J13DRAFT_520878 [Dactylonectria estremocensis]